MLPPYLDAAVANVHQYWLLAELIDKNDSWEEVIKDQVIATLKGKNTYDELTKTDIDTLIQAFKEIQESLDG